MAADLDPAHAAPRPMPGPIYRWLVLLFVSLAMFGNYYVYDSVSPLADVLKSQLGFSDANIGLLNAIYSMPNIVMVLVGGIVIDRIGTKRSLFLFTAIMFAGAALTASSGTLALMAAGRLVFGLGAESQIVAVTTTIARWFKGKELSFAFGLNLTLARLGSFAALNSPSWARGAYESWQGPLLIAAAAALSSLAAATLYWVLEARAESRYDLGRAGPTDKVVWHEVLRFSPSYWLIVALCITFYSGIFPFQTFAVKFFMDAHGTSRELGGFLSSMLTLFAMIGTPLFGLLVDRTGNRSRYMMLGSALLVPVYLMMAYTRISLYVPMAMMGIAFSLIPAVMWPSVAYVVDSSRLGTAYGLMTLIQNVGLAGFNLLIGWANDVSGASAENPGGYALGMWMFSTLGFFGLLFAWLLRRREMGPHGHGLERIRGA
jgi:MFS family permease